MWVTKMLYKVVATVMGFYIWALLSGLLMFLLLLSLPEALLYGWFFKNPPIRTSAKWLSEQLGLKHLW